MRFFALFVAAFCSVGVLAQDSDTDAATATVATAATAASDASAPTASASNVSDFTQLALSNALGGLLTAQNHYGAPIPPWQHGCKPGWYYGKNPGSVLGWILPWLADELICELLDLLPFCLHCPKPKPPPPQSPWTQTFYNLTGATQAADYMTYGLVDTVADCQTMCLNVQGCTFVNSYHDVNGKGGSPLLTCALYSQCHDASDADNLGGQSQPDGSVDFITSSDGYCYHAQ